MRKIVIVLMVLFANTALAAKYCPAKWANMKTVNGTNYDDEIILVGNTASVTNRYESYSVSKTSWQRWRVLAGSGDDTIDLFGDSNGIQVCAGAGDDSIYSGNARDFLYGDGGNDNIQARGGNDVVYGGKGNDQLWGGEGNDGLAGESGDDRVSGNEGDDYLYGGTGHDRIWGGKGRDTLYGQSGDDHLMGDDGWLGESEVDKCLDGGHGYDHCQFGENNYYNCEVEID